MSTGKSVTSLISFPTPIDEYRSAFEERTQPFLNYYTFEQSNVQKRTLTRGEFWDMACLGAAYISERGLSKGDRIVHCFSSNSSYDLVFRLAEALVGCVPVTINWQSDDNERIIYKATITDSKLLLYDKDFAGRIEEIKPDLLSRLFFEVENIEEYQSNGNWAYPLLTYDDEKIIIFTAGTTGKPKGVSLSHRSYLANRLTYEQYFGVLRTTQLDLLLVNPLHHANSTALADWGMRRSGAIIHLVQRYSTPYWSTLVEAASKKRDLFVISVVSRHIDFLENHSAQSKLPTEEDKVKDALSQTAILIGSAPVGPTTVKRILKFSNRLPHVRFGSTETCLQVMAIPTTMTEDETMAAFEAGWAHHHNAEEAVGYYIGREHFPFTRVKIVKNIEPVSNDYMHPCDIGEPGYLITQGANIMSCYVGDEEATKAVFREGWYTGLRDICFALKNKDGSVDYYWMARDSELLIRGGANYSNAQIAAELAKVVEEDFQLKPDQFKLAVVGLRIESEHEDDCCVTIELSKEVASIKSHLKAGFIQKASEKVSKSARPDHIRFAQVPLSFKGTILYPQLKQEFEQSLLQGRSIK
ncbi:AMP-binding protein [Chloroflexota bacterium]